LSSEPFVEPISQIPSGWHKITLIELVTFHRGYDLPLKEKNDGKYPIVGSNGIIGYHDSFKAKGPGVTIGRSGNLGKSFFVNEDYWPHNTTLYSSEFHRSDPSFVYYFLKTLSLSKYNAGSAVPTLNRNHIHTIEIIVPKDMAEQKDIAKVLSSLDSKIELNQQMNKTLEAIGQAIFKRWFVDFEFPNEEGKPYKSSNGKMIDSILGVIPEGWQIGKLSQIADLLMGISPEGTSYNDAGVGMPLLNGAADFKESVIIPGKWTKTPIKICKKGSLLFCIRATIGNLVFADREYCLGRGVAALNPKNALFTEFVYYVLHQSLRKLASEASGSVILGLSKNDVEELSVTIPDNQTLAKFHEICLVLLGKIANQSQNTLTLATIRDCLLPRLMSGKIRVPVPKENVEA